SSAAGHGFARHWLHNGLVNTGGQKMSKSLGNSLFAGDLLAQAQPIVLRYFLGSAHYRSVLEFSPESLSEAAAAFGRIDGFVHRAWESIAGGREDRAEGEAFAALHLAPLAGTATAESLPDAFVAAMLDDFGVPQALAALHDAVRAGNTAIDAGDAEAVLARAAEVVAMLDVLGLDPRDNVWSDGAAAGDDRAASALDALVAALIGERRDARAAKDFATSDAIRDRLAAAGIALEDGPNETRWSLT
ncbi:MAG: DALR domain-containing protein, partial [Leucobacter sp.]